MICLDAVSSSEDTITITSSLRGCITFDIKVSICENNIHSGVGGGVCPNAFIILNRLLMRI